MLDIINLILRVAPDRFTIARSQYLRISALLL